VLLHPPQPARAQLQSDDEQQERDAELGDAQLRLGIADQPEHLRSDQRAGDEKPQRLPQPDFAEQQYEHEREAEQEDAIDQRGLGTMLHLRRRPAYGYGPEPPRRRRPRTPAGSRGAARYAPMPGSARQAPASR